MVKDLFCKPVPVGVINNSGQIPSNTHLGNIVFISWAQGVLAGKLFNVQLTYAIVKTAAYPNNTIASSQTSEKNKQTTTKKKKNGNETKGKDQVCPKIKRLHIMMSHENLVG